jgi:endonuclease-3
MAVPRPPQRRRLRAILRRLEASYGSSPPPRRLPPLDELILTILSQHTSDVNRDRAYADLRRRFPSWDDVAEAPAPAIASAIRRGGLGPTKAVRIKATLRELRRAGVALDDRALTGRPPEETWSTLRGLPGVGPKTAACVLLFSLGEPYFPVDTHVHRVAKRLGLVPAKAGAAQAQEILQRAVPADITYSLHMQLIRHGRAICRAPRPLCEECVLLDLCPRIGVDGVPSRVGRRRSDLLRRR